MVRAVVLAFAVVASLGACKGDKVKCEKACRNFYQLTYWKKADAEIAAAPADQQEALRKKKLAEFTNSIETGIDFCVSQCSSANNSDQIDCMTEAKTADEAQKCVAE